MTDKMPDVIWAGTYHDQETQNEWRDRKMTGSTRYTRTDVHNARVTELLEANNREVERRRKAERALEEVKILKDKFQFGVDDLR